MTVLLEIIVPLIVSSIIAIITYISNNKKKGVTAIVFILVSSVLFFIIVQYHNHKEDFYENDYIKAYYKNLNYIDESNKSMPCNVYFFYGEDRSDCINVFLFDMSADSYDTIRNDAEYYYGYISGFNAGGFERVFGLTIDYNDTYLVENRGFYIDNLFINYYNTVVSEKNINGKDYLFITKTLLVNKSNMLVVELSYEDMTYDFWINSNSANIVALRECFNSIEQKLVMPVDD